MSRSKRRVGYLLGWFLAACLLASCGSSEPPAEDRGPNFTKCGFPEPEPSAEPDLLPEAYLLDGEAIVAKTDIFKKRLIAALHVPHSVNESFDLYKEAIATTEFEVLQEDNEGFEAELYLKGGKELGSVQIRGSKCDDAVIVYVNLPAA